MTSPGRFLVLIGLLLLVVRLIACGGGSPISTAGHGGTGAATSVGGRGGTTTGTGGTGGTAGIGGTGGTAGIGGTGGTTATAGRGGTTAAGGRGGTTAAGGTAGACTPSLAGSTGHGLCGPAPTCDGDVAVSQTYCDQNSCAGAVTTPSRTTCDSGACFAGYCFTRAHAPTRTCVTVMDCGTVRTGVGGAGGIGGDGLPIPVCIGSDEQLIFTDPTCDDGQCHWREIVNICNPTCSGGACYDPGMLTRGPIVPTATPEPTQPPEPAAQACSTASDCSQPQPACFKGLYASVVSYVNPACRAGACVWEFDLSQCPTTCNAGACTLP